GVGLATPNRIFQIKQGAGRAIADGWDVYSSRRWKTNIQPIQGAIDKVKRLTGVLFDWKDSGKHDLGLIAEEVGQVIPEVVTYEENGVDAQSVDYARLVAILIQGMKEQQMTIEQLTKRIDELEKKK
ncbi:MAG: tail fiber domain-containing protein, partial [candidate division KSB1 bacterium]|nr:tail fiber domain-containing protein [candidate division KSB1 bacterium]